MAERLPVHLERDFGPAPVQRLLSPLVPRYRDAVAFANLPLARRRAYEHTLLTDDGAFLFVKNSKAGCSSIAQILYRYSKGAFAEGKIHNQRSDFRQGRHYWRDYEQARTGGKALLFTFVRHPEKRAVSAYSNIFAEKANHVTKHHLAPLVSRGFDDAKPFGTNFSIFLDYVEESLALDPEFTDKHFRPQTSVIAMDAFDYGFIGRMENYVADLKQAFAMAGQDGYLTEDVLGHRFNPSGSAREQLDAGLRRRLETIYAGDYEAFGY